MRDAMPENLGGDTVQSQNEIAQWIIRHPKMSIVDCAAHFSVVQDTMREWIEAEQFATVFRAHLIIESADGRGNPFCHHCGGRMSRIIYGLPNFEWHEEPLNKLRWRAGDYVLEGCGVDPSKQWRCKSCEG